MPKFRLLVPVPEFGPDMYCADDVRDQLLAWRAAVAGRGGQLSVASMTRTAERQKLLRDAYDKYLAAVAVWERKGRTGPAPVQVAAANRPGRSTHQGGRAVDVSTVNPFPRAPRDKQVDLLWETGALHGFTPIISAPDEAASERWHFDNWGSWRPLLTRLGYDTACLCSALDVGQAGEWQSDDRLLQALLLRAGYDIGEPDGIWGKRSTKALGMAIPNAQRGDDVTKLAETLRALPSIEKWVVVR